MHKVVPHDSVCSPSVHFPWPTLRHWINPCEVVPGGKSYSVTYSKLCIVLWLCIDEFGHARYIMAVHRVLSVSWLVAWLLFHETTVYILVYILCHRAVGFWLLVHKFYILCQQSEGS